MKLFTPILLAFTAATLFATVEVAPVPAASGERTVKQEPAGTMKSGPLLGPLTPDEINYEPVSVPEPVWASVLAACAVSLLRRGRR